MTGSRPGLYLCICWKFISPAIMTAILVAFLLKMFFGEVDYEVRSYNRLSKRLIKDKYNILDCYLVNIPALCVVRPGMLQLGVQ